MPRSNKKRNQRQRRQQQQRQQEQQGDQEQGQQQQERQERQERQELQVQRYEYAATTEAPTRTAEVKFERFYVQIMEVCGISPERGQVKSVKRTPEGYLVKVLALSGKWYHKFEVPLQALET